jgi:ClpP class serine protease
MRIIVHKTAVLGSIGVVSTRAFQESPDTDGNRYIEIVSSNAKDKRPDPRTPEGIDTIRTQLDALEKEFITDIALYRNVPVDVVKSEFGCGGVKIGTDAVAANMADSIGTFEQTITELTKKGESIMENDAKITAEFLAENHPDIVAGIKQQGADAERARILALDELAGDGHADLIASAKADPTMTAEKVAIEIVKADKAKGASHIAALKAADAALPTIAPTVETASVGATPTERAEHDWNTKAEIRAEFNGDKDAYIAYAVALENGQIKQLNK